MKDIATLLADPDTTVAVVGATDDPAKFGFQIYRDLKAKGYEVFAVNPNRETVDGDPAYPSLQDLPERPTIVNLVVSPRTARQVLRRAHRLGLGNFWLQPGAGSPAATAFLEEHRLNHLTDACIMVRSRALA